MYEHAQAFPKLARSTCVTVLGVVVLGDVYFQSFDLALSSESSASSLLDAPASALAPLLPDDASSDAGLLDASALTGGESETASGEGGAPG